MPRKRRLTRISIHDIPKIDPNDPVRVEDPVLVRAVLDDFDELSQLPDKARQQLISDLVDATSFAQGGVKVGKRGVSDRATAQQIFISDIGRALNRAGLPARRWRKRYDRGAGPTADAPESFLFRLARELADALGITLPTDLKLAGQRGTQHRYGAMSSTMKGAQEAELAERQQRLNKLSRRLRAAQQVELAERRQRLNKLVPRLKGAER